jgi:ssDNA-binding Zn-finger/Zn-ribbon topoisomerase 1
MKNYNRCLCPECQNSTLELKRGKFGQYVGCADYPNCNYHLSVTKAAKTEYNQLTDKEFFELLIKRNDIRPA